jgi:glycosyltransferase involved in cell wall biosynthesis
MFTLIEDVGSAPDRGGWPVISVVVPTRDRPELLQRAVESIIGQRYPGTVECLIVFDQSERRDVGVALSDGRQLRSITNDRTPGLAGARNAGVLAASGDLVAFCDDDDRWLPDKLRLQVEALQVKPDAVLVACGIEVRSGDRKVTRLPSGRPVTLRDLLRDRLTELHPSTILVRRDALLGPIGLVDEALPGSYAEDYDLLLRAARVAPVLAVPEALVEVYWHASSFFADRWQMIISALQYILQKHPEFREEPGGLARIQGQIAFAHAAAGQPRQARRWAGRTLRHNWRERRAYLALAVSLGLLRADTALRLARAAGRGI